MRVLLYNPNTNRALTAALEHALRERLAPDDRLATLTSDAGGAFVNSSEAIAIARASACAILPGAARECDAILMGCFGDLGLDDLRRALKRPIVSLSDAFFAAVPFLGARISIITTSPFWVKRIKTEAAQRDAARWIGDIRSLRADSGPADVEGESRAFIDEFASGGRCDGVVLAGASLIPLGIKLSADSPLWIADPLALGLGLCRILADAQQARRGRGATMGNP